MEIAIVRAVDVSVLAGSFVVAVIPFNKCLAHCQSADLQFDPMVFFHFSAMNVATVCKEAIALVLQSGIGFDHRTIIVSPLGINFIILLLCAGLLVDAIGPSWSC